MPASTGLPVRSPGVAMEAWRTSGFDPGGWTKLTTLSDLDAAYGIEEVGAASDIE